MLKSVTVINHLGESLKIEMRRPTTSGFYIKKIEGIGPVKANINITERTTIDGGRYNSAHANSRNIVITLGFLFAHNIESVRHRSYKYFPLKKRISLIFETDTRTCETYGYVESNEPDIFSKDEGCQISIICPDSYFYSSGDGSKTVTLFSGTEPMFEFPFSIESDNIGGWLFEDVYVDIFGYDLPAPVAGVSYTCYKNGELVGTATATPSDYGPYLNFYAGPDDFSYLGDGWYNNTGEGWFSVFANPEDTGDDAEDGIEFGEIQQLAINNVRYNGETEVGITIRIHAIGSVSNIAIYNETTGESMRINTNRIKTLTGKEIVAGDDIVICTVKGEKSIQLLREGNWYNIINCLEKYASWFQLNPGDNVFAYTVESGENNIQFAIETRTAYEGV